MSNSKAVVSKIQIGMTVFDEFGASGKIKEKRGTAESPVVIVRFDTSTGMPRWQTYASSDFGERLFFSSQDAALALSRIKTMNGLANAPNRKSATNLLAKQGGTPASEKDEAKCIKDLENFIRSRGINSLVHFTSVENLVSILEHGLLPATLQRQLGINGVCSDPSSRLTDFVSLSVTFPNFRMLYKKINSTGINWIVLFINPAVLLNHYRDFVCCPDNATIYRSDILSNSNSLKGVDGFRRLFTDPVSTKRGVKTRSELSLCGNLTSNPQAEVLFGSRIETTYITGITAEDINARKIAEQVLKSHDFAVKFRSKGNYFGYRHDYDNWR